MTWQSPSRPVLVAVEVAECLTALRVAAAEAGRRRCGVHLLHVLPPVYASHPHIEELSVIAAEQRQAGTAVLASAAATLRSMSPDVHVSTELCHGAVVPALTEATSRACLLVLQHQHTGPGRPRLLSVTRAAVARAQCPVLVVPVLVVPVLVVPVVAPTARAGAVRPPAGQPGSRPLVVAGVVDAARSSYVVETAFVEASRRHARLLLVHGLTMQEAAALREPPAEPLLASIRRALEAELNAWFVRHPDVPAEVEVVPGPAGQSVLSRSHGADLVVVGRGERRVPLWARPGPVADDVLHHADVPVLVVDDVAPDGMSRRERQLSAS